MVPISRVWILALAGTSFLTTGCDQPKPEAYTVPKEERVVQGSVREQLARPDASRGGAPGEFQPGETPENWTAVRPGQFSFATYEITGDDDAQARLTVTAFPGAAGGMLANVNRWRGQLGLASVTNQNLQAATRDIGGIPFRFVLMEGISQASGQKEAIFGAIAEKDGKSWFFKLMGAPSVVKDSEDPLVRFIQTSTLP